MKRFEAFSKGDIWLSASPVLLQYDSSASPVVNSGGVEIQWRNSGVIMEEHRLARIKSQRL